ncbi:SprT family zinc-dependent metalloprotease [uncultured Traorella sp.]|uniref:M48 family metallopeptidase n=1 Tax=uncultured Traorella sp. TaxID=1929048 RepID=UPI0025EC1C8D|nr:SprT family zinc-dependent metalloprotease [uncultured Traorella sp.]
MLRKIKVNDLEICYTLIIKNVKNINLYITRNGEIVVSCNAYVPLKKVDEFVGIKCQWILEKMRMIQQQQKILHDNQRFLFLGKSYPIKTVLSKTSGVRLREGICMIYKRESEDEYKILLQYEKEMAQKILKQKMKEVYEKMSHDYIINEPALKIRKMTSRWGSCMPKKNQITLNSQLIHYQERFIDYVVIHEYAHLIQPNHSKAFYAIIEKYMPDYKEVSKNGPKLITIDE